MFSGPGMGETSVLLQTRYCERSHRRQGPATGAALGPVPPVLCAALKSRSPWPGFSPAAEQSPLINLLSLRSLPFMGSLQVQSGSGMMPSPHKRTEAGGGVWTAGEEGSPTAAGRPLCTRHRAPSVRPGFAKPLFGRS